MSSFQFMPKISSRNNFVAISLFTFLGALLNSHIVMAKPSQVIYAAEEVAPFLARTTTEPSELALQRLLRILRPLVLRNGAGSMTVVARNKEGIGLGLSAMHVDTSGGNASPDQKELREEFDPVNEAPSIGSKMLYVQPEVSTGGTVEIHPAWRIFQPKITLPVDTGTGQVDLSEIRPRVDFTVIKIGLGKLSLGSTGNSVPSDAKIRKALTTWPEGPDLNHGQHNIRTAIQGESVVLVGYPKENGSALSFSTGQIADSAYATLLVQDASDGVESKIPFDPKIEGLVLGYGSSGFSGGAVFGLDGKFLGVLQRAQIPKSKSNPEITPFVRFLTADFILKQLYEHASLGLREFLGPEIMESLAQKSKSVAQRGHAGPIDPSSDEARRLRTEDRSLSCKKVFLN